MVDNIAMETIEIPLIPIHESASPLTINYETEIPAMIINLGKRVLSKPMGSSEIILVAAPVSEKAAMLYI